MKVLVARWRLPLILVVTVGLMAVSINLVTLSLRDSDKIEATRALVAWIVEGRSVSGFGKAYPDIEWMRKQKRFFVICDFIPPEMSLSDDPRVRRITAQERESILNEHGFDGTDYLVIELKEESGRRLVLVFSNAFGPLAAHAYQFEFCRKLWGLRASGMFLWVS